MFLSTKNDALLYAADRIRVNSVHPGFIWTPLVEELAERSTADSDEEPSSVDGETGIS